MTIAATCVGECRPTSGSDVSSGLFNSALGGTDRTLQASAYKSGTSLTVDATTNTDVTPDGYTPDATADPGNTINISAGIGWTQGIYEIKSVVSGKWRLDRSPGATSTILGTWAMGGAFASQGKLASVLTVSQNLGYVKDTGTDTITTTTPGAAGPVLLASGITVRLEGYTTTRGDRPTVGPIISAGAQTTVNLYASQGTTGRQQFVSLKANGNSQSGIVGFTISASGRASAFRCVALTCVTGYVGSRSVARQSIADTCSGTGFVDCEAIGCVAKACNNGFSLTLVAESLTNCLADSCTVDGFVVSADYCWFTNCTADANGTYGFDFAGQIATCLNCLATNHAGGGDVGFYTSGAGIVVLNTCAAYNNTSNTSGTFGDTFGFLTLTNTVYVDQSGHDFRPNTISGGGTSLRAAGSGVYGQTNSIDVGAVQHGDPSRARYQLGI